MMTTHMHPLRAAVIMRNNESHWNGLTSTVVSSSVTSSLTNNVIILNSCMNSSCLLELLPCTYNVHRVAIWLTRMGENI